MTENRWKLQDAKAHLSEVVRCARAGEPQQITIRGKAVVLVVDTERFEIWAKPKKPRARTLAGFVKASKKYRGVAEGVDFEPPLGMTFRK